MLFSAKEKVVAKVIQVEIDKIEPNPYQPRREFDDIEALAQSIEQNGILQPLTVRRTDDTFQLVAGERRLRAAKMLGMEVVPCIPVTITERNSAVMALIENIQRRDLTFFDEAEAIAKLIDFYGMTQEDAAIKLGKSQPSIANKLRLLKLDKHVRKKVSEYGLTERHARALLRLKFQEQQLAAIEMFRSKNMNVEAAERHVELMLQSEKDLASLKKRSVVLKDVRLFVNTLNKAVEMMKAAGIDANSERIQSEDYIEYIVKIPVQKD
ncbi:MAG: ParB/RepB/Spo0J family partition protein [Oscillospiraceae bacterium]|nr:ParB/RepB/Spo0J family partition protein [Oscillospiraceae bacterium]